MDEDEGELEAAEAEAEAAMEAAVGRPYSLHVEEASLLCWVSLQKIEKRKLVRNVVLFSFSFISV